jgi:hypothetical protein
MDEFNVVQQLKAQNKIARWKYLTTGAHTFSASSTGAAYCIVGLRAWRAKSMTNTMCINSTLVTSADTLAAGQAITGRITAITINAGRAAAYIAPDALLLK